MSYSKDPSFYPAEFQEIFRRALVEGADPVEVECEDHQQATNLRHQFHAYRRAVELHKLDGWTDLRKIVIKLDKKKIIFSSNEELMNKLRVAAGIESPSDEDLDKYIERMDKGEQR